MHLRMNTVRRGSKVYRYARLVQSYRREDGMPAHRVIANLGTLDDTSIKNIRKALAASRKGKRVKIEGESSPAALVVEVQENLRYLDLAVLTELWKTSGLAKLLRAALPESEAEVPVGDVIAALVANRCVKPGSKLAAQRWFPTTALPSLLGVSKESFGNSRIHRALDDLDQAEGALQDRLGPALETSEGAFVRLFIDATDTWFEGEGPPLAQLAKGKRKVYSQQVGIVMLCDQRGYPLRWKVLPGHYNDPAALIGMVETVAALPWVQGRVLVLDRAVGRCDLVKRLHDSGLPYITALPNSEYESSGAPIPWVKVAALHKAIAEGLQPEASEQAEGFKFRDNGTLAYDIGLFEKALPKDDAVLSRAEFALVVVQILETNCGASQAELAELIGLKREALRRYGYLHKLEPSVRERIVVGDLQQLDLAALTRIAKAPVDEQDRVLEVELAKVKGKGIKRASRRIALARRPGFQAHGVLSFSPKVYKQKVKDDKNIFGRIREKVDDINRRLARPSNRRTDASAAGEAMAMIKHHRLGMVFDVEMQRDDTGRKLALIYNKKADERRKKSHGLALIVTAPDVPGDARTIATVFFERDIIERGFRCIKSFVKLRPIHHRTDNKLRAHVTICMLSLLLLRILDKRLKDAGLDLTAEAALEILETVHMNLMSVGSSTVTTITRLNEEQRKIITALNMDTLVNTAT